MEAPLFECWENATTEKQAENKRTSEARGGGQTDQIVRSAAVMVPITRSTSLCLSFFTSVVFALSTWRF